MPRLNKFKMTVTTGEVGHSEPVRCKFNTHLFGLNDAEGSTGAGENFSGTFEPRSFVHGFSLVGPEEGTWEIAKVSIDYETDEGDYTLNFGPAKLDETNELNLWYARPREAWDV